MKNDIIVLGLVEPSPWNREAVRNMILSFDWICLEGECNSYDLALEQFATSNLDGIVIGLDEDPPKALNLVGDLALRYPNLRIAVTSSSSELLVQAHRRGATSLMDMPILLEDLVISLKSLGTGLGPNRQAKAELIAVLSSRGGVGSTSIAVNLGASLAQMPGHEVVMIDLDLPLGAADVALGLVPERHVADLATNLERLDIQFIRGSMLRHPCGLWLLSRPTELHEMEMLHEEHIQRILRLLRLMSTHLVIDLSKGWLHSDQVVLAEADAILLVIQPELVSVRNAVHLLNALGKASIDKQVYLVMTRCGAYFGKEAITIKKAEEVLNRLIYWQVPNDYKALVEAWNEGGPLLQLAPKSRAQQAIAAMAEDLYRRINPTEVGRPKKKHLTILQSVQPALGSV